MSVKQLDNYVIIDLETTGLNKSDEIIEIGALRIENHVITQSFSLLVKPEKHIPIEASQVNHIYDSTVANSPNLKIAISSFNNFIRDDDILVGHNISSFDMYYLTRDFKDCINKELSNVILDTYQISKREMKFLASHSLQMLSAYYGIDYSKAHRAVQDCFITYQVYEKMMHDNFESMIKKCPDCKKILKLRLGKYGWFYSCVNYPECTYAENYKPPKIEP